MSHQPKRKENDCLNCGTIVAGRFCQNCGQENVEPKHRFGRLLKHFIYDLFHFDGRFFDTLKYLIFRPGFVPQQYVAGKRHSYLDPIRMYLFTSAFFFLIFFSVFKAKIGNIGMDRQMTTMERFQYASKLHSQTGADTNAVLVKQMNYLLDTAYSIVLKDSGHISNDTSFAASVEGKDMVMVPVKTKSGIVVSSSSWLENKLNSRWTAYKKTYGDDSKAIVTQIIEAFLHRIPYLLFISLPFFALILKLLYNRKKDLYYSDHVVFTLYHYIFAFILLLFLSLFGRLYDWLGWGIFDIMRIIIFLSGGVYLFFAMKRFYMQGNRKTLVKFLLLNFLAGLVVVALFFGFFIFSIFQL